MEERKAYVGQPRRIFTHDRLDVLGRARRSRPGTCVEISFSARPLRGVSWNSTPTYARLDRWTTTRAGTAARRRQAARIDIPGLRRFRRQRQIRERGIQLGLGLLFLSILGPFFLLLLQLAFVLGFFAPKVRARDSRRVVLLTNDSNLRAGRVDARKTS